MAQTGQRQRKGSSSKQSSTRRRRPLDEQGIIPILARAVREVENAAERGAKVSPSNRTKFQVAALLVREERARVKDDREVPDSERAEVLKRLDGLASIMAKTAARDTSLIALLAPEAKVSDAAKALRRDMLLASGAELEPDDLLIVSEPEPVAPDIAKQVVPKSVKQAQLANPFLAPDLAALLSSWGLAEGAARLALALVLAGGLGLLVLRGTGRGDAAFLAGGAAIGLLVAAGWYATGVLGFDDFEPAPLASLTFVAPVGETIQYAMLATGMRPSFGVAVVAGVFLGALVAALASGTARLEGFSSPRAMLRAMAGGALMGAGGALALGCSIGQGLTGLSTLALTSFLAAGGILAGAWVALRGPLRVARQAVAEQS